MEPTEPQGTTENQVENAGKDHTRGGAREAVGLDAAAELDAFRDYLRALKYHPSSIGHYVHGIGEFLAFLARRCRGDLRAVTRADIRDYQAGLGQTKLSTNTAHSRLRAVRRLYEFLDDRGRILMNPAVDIPMPKLERPLPRVVLTRAEIRRILDAPDTSLPVGIRDKAMLEVFYSTGVRLAELCGLTIHDVDLLNGYLRVNCGKGCKDRVVPLGHKARQYVNEYLRKVRGQFTARRRDERALFVGERGGRPIHPKWVTDLVRRYAKRAGIRKRVTPHVFRHTCATHMLSGGADVSQVQRLLGHVLINTTQVYTRVAQPEVKATHRKTHPREKDREA